MKRIAVVFLIFAMLCSMTRQSVAAQSSVVYHYESKDEGCRIALTFDDGPHPRYTDQILKILAEYGVVATFFVIGENADAYPELVRRTVEEGHEVANHTYHHYHTARIDLQTINEEMQACAQSITRITGERPRLFRPPEGVYNEGIGALCTQNGYTAVLWSIDTEDWAHRSPCTICRNVSKNAKDGAIILMHDFIGKNSPTPSALRQMIPMLLAKGFEFVTVSDLISN